MTRQDYEIIAGTLHLAYESMEPLSESARGVVLAAQALAAAFLQENPRFDYSKFMTHVMMGGIPDAKSM